MIEKQDNLEQKGLDKLISQFQGRPRYEALLRAFLELAQVLEDEVWDVLLSRLVDTATGESLKTLGRLVGELYEGQDEETYRLFVKARIATNRSKGHPDDVIHVLQIIEAAPFRYSEVYPMTIVIDYTGTPSADPQVLYELARRARGGGVKLYLNYGEPDFFCNCAGLVDVDDSVQGAAPRDESSGGYMSATVRAA